MKKRIQIILEDGYLAGIYGRRFEQEGYKVTVAESFREAMAQAARVKPDVILLDIHTVEDPETALETLHANPVLKSCKLLLLGSVTDHDKMRHYTRTSNGYLLYGHFIPREAIQKVNNLFQTV